MLDLVLRGGRVVDPEGIGPADLGVRDGRVAARLRPGEPATARAEADVTGRLLMAGLVDAHVHLREPGLTWKEDFASGTQAAIAGGVTTVLVMPTDDPWTASAADLAAKRALAEGRVHADVGFQVALRRDHADLDAMAELGAVSFELFTSDVPDAFSHDGAARLTASIAAVHRAGGRAAVSPGDQGLLDAALARLTPGRSSAADFVASRPPVAEANGIARAVLAAAATGAPVHIRQSNTGMGMATFRRLRDLADVSIETTPQCLILRAEDYDRLGPRAKASPPLRPAADRDAVRAALADGVIDVVATDHAPHTDAEKFAAADDFANVPGGFPGLQTLLPTLLSLVGDGLIGLADVARVAAARPAERFGLGGRKGRLDPGHDADILVLDPTRPTTVRTEDQVARVRYTPFDGLTAPFALERVLLRGVQVAGPNGLAGVVTGTILSGRG